MNKMKLALVTIAVMAGIGGAFAMKPCVQCETATQYIYNGSTYVQVNGVWGEDYACLASAGTCTYYIWDPMGHPGAYAPCRTGTYTLTP